jgi:hypothetical protein
MTILQHDTELDEATLDCRAQYDEHAPVTLQRCVPRYLWAPGLQVGAPERFMGYPVRVDQYMPALATGSLSLAVASGGVIEGSLKAGIHTGIGASPRR